MKTWIALYKSHRSARTVDPSWTTEVRKKLIALADAKHCDEEIRGRFSNRNLGDLVEWSIRKNGDQVAEPLTGLAVLETAEISVLLLFRVPVNVHDSRPRAARPCR